MLRPRPGHGLKKSPAKPGKRRKQLEKGGDSAAAILCHRKAYALVYFFVQCDVDNAARPVIHTWYMARGTYIEGRVRVYKKRLVIRLLRKTGGNVKKAAALIDERRSRLYRIMRASGIKASDFRRLRANPR